MKTTFKTYLADSLFENITDTTVYRVLGEQHYYSKDDCASISALGVLMKENELIGFKDDLKKAIKVLNILKSTAIFLADDYVAEKYNIDLSEAYGFSKNDVLETLNARKMPYAIKLGKKDLTSANSYEAFLIKEKAATSALLPNIELSKLIYGSKHHNVTVYLRPLNAPSEYSITNDENYIWIESHVHDISTEAQTKKGLIAIQLPQPQVGTMLIYQNGYVRIDRPAASKLQLVSSPTGDTPEEKMINALKFAKDWLKRNC